MIYIFKKIYNKVLLITLVCIYNIIKKDEVLTNNKKMSFLFFLIISISIFLLIFPALFKLVFVYLLGFSKA